MGLIPVNSSDSLVFVCTAMVGYRRLSKKQCVRGHFQFSAGLLHDPPGSRKYEDDEDDEDDEEVLFPFFWLRNSLVAFSS